VVEKGVLAFEYSAVEKGVVALEKGVARVSARAVFCSVFFSHLCLRLVAERFVEHLELTLNPVDIEG